jgi:hypothetical protein
MRNKLTATVALACALAVFSGANLWALKLDIKTKVTEKAELTPVIIGASYYLIDSGIELVNFGEQYAAWVEQPQRTQKGDIVTEQLLVKITKPSLLREAPTLASTTVVFSYDTNLAAKAPSGEAAKTDAAGPGLLDNRYVSFFRQKATNATQLMILEGKVGGRVVADAIIALLKSL